MRDESAASIYALVFGSVIAQLREKKGLTQGDLAKRVGVNQSAVSRMERGQARPDPFELRALAAAFGISTGELTEIVDQAFERAEVTAKATIRTGAQATAKAALWSMVLGALGSLGVAGLAGVAVAAVLVDRELQKQKDKKPKP